ncbi:uncharacterized protein METZ01_LOCUS61473 [marine metagenome]|uniref:RNA-binding S4 domain-containing protein n=1 Tax=marine metagenome TaxID=408172 RepID=A0A381SYT7_9ZZZZ
MAEQRLQKIIAAAGIASRRKAETFIVAGRVAVNGKIVIKLGTIADPAGDLITLDGTPLLQEPLRYFIVNKPRGVLCAVTDKRDRPLVVDFLPDEVHERLFPAGRLDLDSEGLVLLTNDGDLMQKTTRPGGGVLKIYDVMVGGRPSDADLDTLRSGWELDGQRLLPCDIEVLERIEVHEPRRTGAAHRGFTRIQVTLQQGRKNQIRRMFQGVGHRVERLVRYSIGPISLNGLPVGGVRELHGAELREFKAGIGVPK